MSRSENDPRVRTRATVSILLSKERNGSHPVAPAAGQTSHPQRPVLPNKLFGAYSTALGPFSSCQLRALRRFITHVSPSSFLSLIRLVPGSITHTSTTTSTHVAYGEADHAPTRSYRLVSFRLAYLADAILRFSHWISTYSNHALNPPRIIAPATD